jgi:hypothetical protein
MVAAVGEVDHSALVVILIFVVFVMIFIMMFVLFIMVIIVFVIGSSGGLL